MFLLSFRDHHILTYFKFYFYRFKLLINSVDDIMLNQSGFNGAGFLLPSPSAEGWVCPQILNPSKLVD